jgi:hypothetical protein
VPQDSCSSLPQLYPIVTPQWRELGNGRRIVTIDGGLELLLGNIGDADGGDLLVAGRAGALTDFDLIGPLAA